MEDTAKFIKDLPTSIHACVGLKNSTDIKRIAYWFTQFGDWHKIITIIVSNALKNYKNIYDLGIKMVDDANAGNWNLSGHDFGQMWPEVLGPIPTNPPAHMLFEMIDFVAPDFKYYSGFFHTMIK